MKKITLLLLIIFSTFKLIGQNNVRINVVIPPPYPDYLSYYREPNRMVITITNLTTKEQNIYLRGSIIGVDNSREIHTKPGYRPSRPLSIPAGIGQTISVSSEEIQELYSPSNLNFFNTDTKQITATDRIGEGTYRICVRAYDYRQPTVPLSADNIGCSTVFMRNLEAPMLILPQNDALITANGAQNVIFSWTKPAGAPVDISYRLRIVEIFDSNKNPQDLFLSSLALFDQEVHNNVYVMGPADPPLEIGRKYAWAITALDPSRSQYRRANSSLFQNNGLSEIRTFVYQTPNIIIPPKKEVPKINTPELPKESTILRPELITTIDTIPPKLKLTSGTSDIILCDCKSPIPTGGELADIKTGDDITVNSFTMKVTQVSKNSSGSFSGTGTIPIPLINNSFTRLRVSFLDLEVVNTGNKKVMTKGQIKGISKSSMSFLPNADKPGLDPAPLTLGDISTIDDFFKTQTDQLVSNLKNAGNSVGFELPIGLDKGPVTIGITQVFFTPTQAWFNAVTSLDIPDGNSKAAFEMTGACMTSEKLCGEFKLRLKEDLELPSINLKLVQGDLLDKGTYIIFDKDGFHELSLALDYKFHGGLKKVSDHQNITARLSARTKKGWGDWLATVEMPDFYVDGIPSIKFSLGSKPMYYDHSDIENPSKLPSSITVSGETYNAIGQKTWHGFYIPEITVMLPAIIKNTKKQEEDALAFTAENFIIDNTGLTGVVKNKVSPILPIGDGSLDGWYFSVDDISLNFFKSGFKESKMTGKMALPGTKHSELKNQIDYISLLSKSSADLEYSFNLKPKNDLRLDALFAEVNIADNSIITIEAGGGKDFVAKSKLSGKISINSIGAPIPGIGKLEMPGLTFENLKFQTTSPFWDKSEFAMEFASPQKKVAGFNFTIDKPDVDVALKGTNAAEVKLIFNGKIALVEEVWTSEASTAVSVSATFEKKDNRITFAGVGAKLENIDFGTNAQLGPVTIGGYIRYYNQNNKEGFIGALQAQIAEFVGVNMKAEFGVYGSGNSAFKYFNFEALADFGNTGIALAPPVPLALYGFGGGFAYNMKASEGSLPKTGSIPNKAIDPAGADPLPVSAGVNSGFSLSSESPLSELLKSPSGITWEPKKGDFGLTATILFGLTSRNTLDADANLSMGFTNSGGVSFIKITANARVLTDISKPIANRTQYSTGVGKLIIDFNFSKKSFRAYAELGLGVPTYGKADYIKAKGFIEFASDSGRWHLYAGRPRGNGEGPWTVELLSKKLLNMGAGYFFNGDAYFEIGTRVDDIPEIPQEVYRLAGGTKTTGRVEQPPHDPKRGMYSRNSGLIVGAHVGFSTGKIRFLMFYGSATAKAGFDISIKQGVLCAGYNASSPSGGAGGWYANGQAYFGAEAEVGISVNLLLVKGDFPIFTGGAGAIIKAGLPNPTYVDGIIGGYFSILDGLVKGKFNLKMSIGEKCSLPNDVFGGLEIISEILPAPQQDPPLSILTTPSVVFNLKVGKTFVFEDFENLTKKGDATLRCFTFDADCITFLIKEGSQAEKEIPFNFNTFSKSFQEDAYAINLRNAMGISHLKKNTIYQVTVKARIKELFLSVSNSGDKVSSSFSNAKYLMANGKHTTNKNMAAVQQMKTTFKTDDGFSVLPKNIYANSSPLHSYKKLPYREIDNEMFLELRGTIDYKNYLQAASTESTLQFRVFKDGIQETPDIPVTVKNIKSNTIFSIPKVNLQPNASYTFALLLKNPTSANTVTTQKVATSGYLININSAKLNLESNTFVQNDIAIYKTIQTGPISTLSAGEFFIGGYSFNTSKYATYQDKLNDIKLTKLTLLTSAQKELGVMTSPNQKTQNKQLFEKLIKPDANGEYIILLGDSTNLNLKGDFAFTEHFSQLDERSAFIPKEIFLGSELGGQIPIIKKIDGYKEYTNTNIYGGRTLFTNQLIPFLATYTGIPVNKIKFKDGKTITRTLMAGFKAQGGDCNLGGGLYAYRISENDLPFGQKIPDNIPSGATNESDLVIPKSLILPFTSISTSNNSSPLGISYSWQSPSMAALYLQNEHLANCQSAPVQSSDLIQRHITDIILSRVNPAQNVSKTGADLNQVSTWQTVNQVGLQTIQGILTPDQLSQEINTIMNK